MTTEKDVKEMKQIQFSQEIPVRKQVDVLIAGGGPAGVAAAVTAARMGASVFLAEKHQSFGGAATLAAVPAFMRFSDGENFLAGGIGREVFDAMYGAQADYTAVELSIETERLKRFYDTLVVDSGADFLFDTSIVAVQAEQGAIQSVVLQGHECLYGVEAKTYIDCTGDGTLSTMAGAAFGKGDAQGRMMPATLCSLWRNIDWERAIVEVGKDPDNRMLPQAFADGVFSIQDSSLPGMWQLPEGMGGGNIGHVFGIDGTDEKQLTQGIIEARRRMKEYEHYYTHYLEGYKNARVVYTGSILGIRETRRILGDYVLSTNDYANRASFEDEIGRYCYPIDLHPVVPGAQKTQFDEDYHKGYGKGNSYGIPYRCLLPRGTTNLLVAGRCISTSREMNGSTRVMPCCYITGMAAGAAAALAKDGMVRNISIASLQTALRDCGAYLPNATSK